MADNAVIGNCKDTVNVISDPVGNITDLFRRDLGCMDDIVDNVVFLYLTDVSLAILKELPLCELVFEAWHNGVRKMTRINKVIRTAADDGIGILLMFSLIFARVH